MNMFCFICHISIAKCSVHVHCTAYAHEQYPIDMPDVSSADAEAHQYV
jgi:hypothetical protein